MLLPRSLGLLAYAASILFLSASLVLAEECQPIDQFIPDTKQVLGDEAAVVYHFTPPDMAKPFFDRFASVYGLTFRGEIVDSLAIFTPKNKTMAVAPIVQLEAGPGVCDFAWFYYSAIYLDGEFV